MTETQEQPNTEDQNRPSPATGYAFFFATPNGPVKGYFGYESEERTMGHVIDEVTQFHGEGNIEVLYTKTGLTVEQKKAESDRFDQLICQARPAGVDSRLKDTIRDLQ